MEQTHTKPTKKRRRWLIVAFVLVLVSTCSWWNWPRGDARFVGKWALVTEATGKTFGTLTFRPSGITSLKWEVDAVTGESTWSVDDDSLVLGPNQDEVKDVLLVCLDDWLYRRLLSRGGTSRLRNHRVRVISVTPETMRLEWDGKPGRIGTGLLRRVPE